MKLRKVVEEFKVKSISRSLVTMVGRDGHEYVLRVNDGVSAHHDLTLTGKPSAVRKFASDLKAIGFFEVRDETLQ